MNAVVAALDRHLWKSVPYDAAYRIRRTDGDYVWWHDVGYAERDAAGKPFRMAGTCVDITERKKSEDAERALKASERWLAETQRVARLGWYPYDPASDAFTVSETVDEILGIGEDFRTGARGGCRSSPGRPRARAQADAAGPRRPAHARPRYRIVRPSDGQERHVHARASAVFDESGRVVRILGTIQDLTDRKRDEGEIRQLAAAVEQVAQSVVITDTDGTIQYVNAAFTAITGYAREAALGMTPRLLKSGLHEASYYENLWRTVLAGETSGPLHEPEAERGLYEVEATITPVRDSLGNLACFVCLEHDITEILAQQKKLQEKETFAAIGEIAANIAHEVKNPLFAISSGIQLLMEELTLEPDQRRTFEVIHGDVLRMDRLVRQLQLLSARRPLEPAPRSMAALVEGAVTLNRGLAAEKALAIETSLEEGLPDLWVDEDQIHQVLLNLLQNAISYSPAGGRIRFEAARCTAGNRVVLRVRNEGPRVPDEIRDRIFEPFFTTRHPSAGMGLAISRRIALDHGGSLRLEPAPEGGAVFALELPVRRPS